jgi:hypothetical protein
MPHYVPLHGCLRDISLHLSAFFSPNIFVSNNVITNNLNFHSFTDDEVLDVNFKEKLRNVARVMQPFIRWLVQAPFSLILPTPSVHPLFLFLHLDKILLMLSICSLNDLMTIIPDDSDDDNHEEDGEEEDDD